MNRKHEDESAELILHELENILYTEKKHFFLTSFIKKASKKVNYSLLKRLMTLFKQDKPQIRENIATLINELIGLAPQEEVSNLNRRLITWFPLLVCRLRMYTTFLTATSSSRTC